MAQTGGTLWVKYDATVVIRFVDPGFFFGGGGWCVVVVGRDQMCHGLQQRRAFVRSMGWTRCWKVGSWKRETVVDVDRVQQSSMKSGPPAPGEVDSELSPPAEPCASKATKKKGTLILIYPMNRSDEGSLTNSQMKGEDKSRLLGGLRLADWLTVSLFLCLSSPCVISDRDHTTCKGYDSSIPSKQRRMPSIPVPHLLINHPSSFF